MTKNIDISNYESFYLDYLEGNLSEELTIDLLDFLDEHPELIVSDDFLPEIALSSETMDPFEKNLLFKSTQNITAENISIFLIKDLEGQLTHSEKTALHTYVQSNPQILIEQQLFSKTILSKTVIPYPNKNGLKKTARIIPLYWTSTAAAASILLFFALYNSTETNETDSNKGNAIAQQNKVRTHQKNTFSAEKNSAFSAQNKPENTAEKKVFDLPRKEFTPEDAPSLAYRKLNWKNTDKQILLPVQNISTEPTVDLAVKDAQTVPNDLAYSGMTNPIKPITTSIAEKLNTVIDFRTAKPTNVQKGGFYLKIGKFEILRKRSK